jgi:pimeloyl-ACP methyl ester carboxylesterase
VGPVAGTIWTDHRRLAPQEADVAGTTGKNFAAAGGPPAVVLVHGAWQGAWCWERAIAALAAAGIRALAIDLPGHGNDPGPMSDLHGDAARVGAVLDSLDRPVILAGHAYGGAVITEAGSHPAVSHLVYVGAWALDDGETCSNAASEEAVSAGISHAGRPDLAAGFVAGPGSDGTVTLDPDVARACLYADCDPATAGWAIARLGPQPLVTLHQQPQAVAWRTRPSTYVVCVNDQAIHPVLQRILARRCITAVEWPTGHAPFLSRPDLLTGLLSGLRASLAA